MIYLAHPRTASRATRTALRGIGFLSSGNHHAPLDEHPGPDWTVFTAVRNHYDAWASWWCKTGGEWPFTPDWIEMKLDSQDRYFPDPSRMWGLHSGVANVILRYETLEADLEAVLGGPLALPRVGGEKRNGEHYRDLIPAAAHAYIGTRWAEEMEEFGYGW